MKKVLCILLSALMVLSMAAFAEVSLHTNNETVQETVEQKLYRMLPVLDSFARNMGIESEDVYNADDPQFFWTQMYLMAVNWAADDARVSVSEAQMTVPADVIAEYAQAAFGVSEDLPAIPQDLTSIRYDEATGTYVLDLSDAGDAFIVIERYAVDEDGTLLVGVGLYSGVIEDDERLGGFFVRMAAPLNLGFADANAFPYNVENVQAETADDFNNLVVTDCAIQYVEPAAEVTPTATAQPFATTKPSATAAAYPELSMGSRGEAVKALQQRLNKLGYDCGSSDGIFGAETKLAVRYFQDAIGVKQNGVASSALQQKLYASGAPEFVTYVQLKEGSTGVRVEALQVCLRDLGYLAAPVDGDFGSRTEDAVKLFQKKADLKVDGIAGVATLKALSKKSAPACDSYITLKKGDTGSRVKEMQNRLYKLGFAEKKANGTYDNNTVKAVKAFIAAVGETGDGKTADKDMIKKMFNYTPAPSATPEVTPTATPVPEVTPTPTPVPEVTPTATPVPEVTPTPTPVPATPTPAVITEQQLADFTSALNTALSQNYTNEQAVTWLQQQLTIAQSGIYDQTTKDAVSAYQGSNGLTVNGVADADLIAQLIV